MMSGENIIIDYLCDHCDKFEMRVTFERGEYVGEIVADSKVRYKSKGKSEPQLVFDELCEKLSNKTFVDGWYNVQVE